MKIDAKILKIDFKFNTHSLSILNPFWPSVTFHIETSNLSRSGNQMTGFYVMPCKSVMD